MFQPKILFGTNYFSIYLNIYSDESNFGIFDNNIIKYYSETENCFDVDMINADHPDESVDIIDNNKHNNTIIDNNKHKETLSHKSYTTICNELYNIMRKIKIYQHLLFVWYWT